MVPDGFRDLLRKAQSGDEGAAERILTIVRGHLSQSAAKFADLGHAAESTSDLVQEASLKVWQRLDQFRGGESDDETLAMFLAWSVQNVRANEEADVIRDAVNRLPDELDRAMLRLRFFEGRSLRQIAEELPLSYDQVRDRFRGIMRRLERELEGLL